MTAVTSSTLLALLLGLLIGAALGALWVRARSAPRAAALEAALSAERRSAAERLELAREEAQRRRSVEELVSPVAASLDQLAHRVAEAERARDRATTTLRTELDERTRQVWQAAEAVRVETSRLAGALGRSEVRGRWGEAQLRRLVESAGLLERVDFTEQAGVRGDDGVQRPDLVVHLGSGRDIVVDAKVSLHALIEAEEATDAATRDAALRRHAAVVAAHVDRLASKEYWRQFPSAPEFVVLFLPAESLLGSTLAVDPALLDRAFSRGVVIATPVTFLALLGTVAHAWRQDTVARNAREVHTLGRELLDRLSTMAGHLGRVGSSLDAAVSHYNRMVASLDGRVLVTARRLQALGVSDTEPVTPAPVERVTRRARAPELAGEAAPGLLEDALHEPTARPGSDLAAG